MKRIALLGCGAIGTQIALAIDSGQIPARLTHVYDSDRARAEGLASSLGSRPEVVENFHLLSSQPVDLVVEAASQQAVRDAALSVLQNRKDLVIMSAGALLDEAILDVITDACRDFGRAVHLPSVAIAGLDALRAVRGQLDRVTLTTTKHPDSLAGAPYFEQEGVDPASITGQTVLYEGPAGRAVSLFPANVNVAALLALATLGSEGTTVRIVADPGTDANTHLIEASGSFGSMSIRIQNVPDSANPKTSRLAMLSAIDLLRRICQGPGMPGS